MNAYELADLIEEDMEEGFGMGFLQDAVNMIRQQADRIAELEKQQSAEPVAWMSPDSKFCKTEGKLFYIPLYTTPQIKELSDEEIQDLIINKVTDADMIRQALKKASEK